MRLVDADTIYKRLSKDLETGDEKFSISWFRSWICTQETVDAVEVVHGHWKEYLHSALVRWKDGEPVWADRSVFRCSRCDFGTIARHNYCPRCGAKMDLEKDYD